MDKLEPFTLEEADIIEEAQTYIHEMRKRKANLMQPVAKAMQDLKAGANRVVADFAILITAMELNQPSSPRSPNQSSPPKTRSSAGQGVIPVSLEPVPSLSLSVTKQGLFSAYFYTLNQKTVFEQMSLFSGASDQVRLRQRSSQRMQQRKSVLMIRMFALNVQ
ncbi:hypothetical protein RvY_01829 [Ramazzottius varieornatus]|uniref:Uncharacterized protein n=1 Tax=Ramazzottius varieornatus TaxID=947166 RepID=A0A1D1UHS6_RAMVA|nr:hypothetical protein RvY_01829 [Ramazzottius varieornatus]